MSERHAYTTPDLVPELGWTAILAMFDAFLVTWETGEPTPPFPPDPDGGELRLVGALRSLVDAAMLAEDQGVAGLSTEFIRRHLSRKLTER